MWNLNVEDLLEYKIEDESHRDGTEDRPEESQKGPAIFDFEVSANQIVDEILLVQAEEVESCRLEKTHYF